MTVRTARASLQKLLWMFICFFGTYAVHASNVGSRSYCDALKQGINPVEEKVSENVKTETLDDGWKKKPIGVKPKEKVLEKGFGSPSYYDVLKKEDDLLPKEETLDTKAESSDEEVFKNTSQRTTYDDFMEFPDDFMTHEGYEGQYETFFIVRKSKKKGAINLTSHTFKDGYNLGFHSDDMETVYRFWMSPPVPLQGIESFVTSQKLVQLTQIDLSWQKYITDDHIEIMAKNKAFRRLYQINLVGNKGITNKTMDLILKSDVIASIRRNVYVSKKYSEYTSIVNLDVSKTSVSQIKAQYSEENPRKDFKIYVLDIYDKPVNQDFSTVQGIKEISCYCY